MVKTCCKCKVEKIESLFYKNKRGKNGLMSRCKACVNKQNNAYILKNADKRKGYAKKHKKGYAIKQSLKHGRMFYKSSANTMFNCCTCKINKKGKEFYKCPTLPRGYRHECISCCKEKNKSREYDNEKIRKRMERTLKGLRDPYIKQRLKRRGFSDEIIATNPVIIETVREILKIKRLCKRKNR